MSRAPRSILGILTAIVISFVVVTYALSFALAALAIITTQLGPNLLRLNGVLPVYLFALISLRIIPANGLILVIVLMAIFSARFCHCTGAEDSLVRVRSQLPGELLWLSSLQTGQKKTRAYLALARRGGMESIGANGFFWEPPRFCLDLPIRCRGQAGVQGKL